MNPRISKVIPLKNHKLTLFFTNGEKGIYDCSKLLNFGVFKELQNKNYFKKAFVLHGILYKKTYNYLILSCFVVRQTKNQKLPNLPLAVAWPNEQDICPDTLYIDSIKQK